MALVENLAQPRRRVVHRATPTSIRLPPRTVRGARLTAAMLTHDSAVSDLAVPVLTDRDVLARVRSQADGQEALAGRSLRLMFLSPEGLQLPAVVAIDDVPELPDPGTVANLWNVVACVLADSAPGGSVVFTLCRPGPLTAGDADRYWFRATRRAAREVGVRLRMMCLAGTMGVRQLTPEDAEVAGTDA